MTARFDPQLQTVRRQLDRWRRDGRLCEVAADSVAPWPAGRSLVLSADVAAELGSPAVGSWSLMIWSGDAVPGGVVGRVGPDVGQLGASAPLGRIVLVQADFDGEAAGCIDLREGVCGTPLRGVTLRTRPSSGEVWTRVSRRALDDGFSLDHLGAAVVERLRRVEGVAAVSVLWVTDPEVHRELRPTARDTERIAGALLKRHDEDVMECGSCEFNDICDESEVP